MPRTVSLAASLFASLITSSAGCGSEAPRSEPALSAPPPATAVASAWTEHVSAACRFGVKLPYPPSSEPTPPGLLDQIATEAITERVALVASCGDVSSVGSPREFLEVTAGIIARQLGATIDQTAEIELQGRPGLELRMTVPEARKPPAIPWPGELSYRLRLYVAGTRQYQLHVLHPRTAAVRDMVERFWSGFRLLEGAPDPTAPLAWSSHSLQGVVVEAPGEPLPLQASAELLHGVRFGAEGRSTPYALSLWSARLSGESPPMERLRAHFRRIAPPKAEILEQTPTRIAGRPALALVYRPNVPLPEHLAPEDAKTRQAVEQLIERNPSVFHLRLVLDGDRIVQLLVADPGPTDDPERFFDSLSFAG